MTALFLKILEMSALGSVVILITMLLRMLLRKKSKSLIMILWLMVAIKLLVPIDIESSFSIYNLLPSFKTESVATAIASHPTQKSNISQEIIPENQIPQPINKITVTEKTSISPVQKSEAVTKPAVADKSQSQKTTPNILQIAAIIWLAGTLGVLVYCIARYIVLKIELKDAVKIDKHTYQSEKVSSPFVFGFIIPRIYLPDVLNDVEKEYVLLHENTHIEHGDWISKLVGMLIVSIHWFNPLVWLGYFLFERDLEMNCDESVIRNLDNSHIEDYSITIVSFSKTSHNARYLVTPLGFSKVGFSKKEITNRIKNIINYRKESKLTAVITTVCLLTLSAACTFNQKTKIAQAAKNALKLAADYVTYNEFDWNSAPINFTLQQEAALNLLPSESVDSNTSSADLTADEEIISSDESSAESDEQAATDKADETDKTEAVENTPEVTNGYDGNGSPGQSGNDKTGPHIEEECDANGNVIKETEYGADGSVINVIYNEYDSQNRLIRTEYTNPDVYGIKYVTLEYNDAADRIKWTYFNVTGSVVQEMTYTASTVLLVKMTNYDGNGNSTETNYSANASGVSDIESEITYDSNGNIISKKVYKYNEYRDYASVTLYDANENIISKTVYEYDEYGDCLSEITYDGEGNVISKITNDIDDDGNKTETAYDGNEDIVLQITYETIDDFTFVITIYDDDGNIISKSVSKYNELEYIDSEITYDGEGNITSETYYEYEFNESNYPIAITAYDGEGNIIGYF